MVNMTDTDRAHLERMLDTYGTVGVAIELQSICAERAKTAEDAECRPIWQDEAARYAAHV